MRTYTEDEWFKRGEELYGKAHEKWRFKCPRCGNVMSIEKAKTAFSNEERATLKEKDWRIEQECVGRHIQGVGCDWCAYGLFRGPDFVKRKDGSESAVFPFDAPEER